MGRQAGIMVATGSPGVGKSYQTEKELRIYAQPDASVGRAGRKVLIFDTNNEYGKVKSVAYNVKDPHDNGKYIKMVQNIELRRIMPFWSGPDGSPVPMSFDDKMKTLMDIMRNYRNGCVLLEDLNTYLLESKNAETVSFLCSSRHMGLDIIIHLQSLSAVYPRMWQNLSFVRFHYQNDDISRYKARLGENFEPLKICQNVVNTEYFKGNIRYFLYFNNKTKKITGCTREQYMDGLDMYGKEHKLGAMLTKNPFMYFD